MSTDTRKIAANASLKEVFQQSEKLFRALIENSSDAIALVSQDGIFTYISPSVTKILGFRPEELLGRNTRNLFPPDQLATALEKFETVAKTPGLTVTVEHICIHKDGSIRWLETTVTNHLDDPDIQAFVANFHDITERKQTEETERFLAEVSKVLTSSLDYKTTLSNIAQLVVPQLADWFIVDLVDANGNFELIEVGHKDPGKVQWARELRNRYPIDPDATSGVPNVVRSGKSQLYPEVTDEMLVASARDEEELAIFRQLGFTSTMIVPLVARGKTLGVVTFVSTESGRKYDADGLAVAEEIGRRAGVALDNARLYKEVQEARDQLNVILQGVADGITVQDISGRLIYANDVAAKMSGFPSAAAMLGASLQIYQRVLSRFEMRDEAGNLMPSEQLPGRRALRGEQNVQAIVQYYDKAAGQTRWSLVKAEPIFDEQGQVQFAVNVITDITEREELERRKDEFISMASHELKTPVTSLKGFTNVLQRRLSKQADEQSLHFLTRMDAQLNKLTKLISDLLDISRMQTGKMTFQEECFDLNEIIHEIVENLQATTSTHQLHLKETAHVQVIGDQDRIGQVLINLITNAIKYSPQADTVIIQIAKDQENALVSVQDFGIGIAEAHQQRVFERFYRIADPEEKTYPGLGIGLYISYQIIQRHHGRMWVKSKKGAGAAFYFTLPLAQVE